MYMFNFSGGPLLALLIFLGYLDKEINYSDMANLNHSIIAPRLLPKSAHNLAVPMFTQLNTRYFYPY